MRNFIHIAQLIRRKRATHPKRYSQSELSHLLGYKNGQFISNVERALCSVPLKMLKTVAEVLDISITELKEAILRDQETVLDIYLRGEGFEVVGIVGGSGGDDEKISARERGSTKGHGNYSKAA